MRSERGRRLDLAIVGGTLAIVVALLTSLYVFQGPIIDSVLFDDRIECDEFEFDRTTWIEDEDDRESQADALARCGTLVGLGQVQVRSMLADDVAYDEKGSVMRFVGGWDENAPGEKSILIVEFSRGERVRSALFKSQWD